MSNELIKVTSDLSENTASFLREQFLPFIDDAEKFTQEARQIIVTDESQKDLIKKARESRLALKSIRTAADKKRKILKEDSIRYGKAVQGIYNIIEYMVVPAERHLQEQEDFAKLQEEKRIAEIREKRSLIAQEFEGFMPSIDYSGLEESAFLQLIESARIAKKAKEDADAKAELERVEQAKAEALERERVRLENEKLKAEAEALRKERERMEAEARAIRQKQAEDEAKARAKAEAEAEALRKELSAPDKNKLLKVAGDLRSYAIPDLKDQEMILISHQVKQLLNKIADHIESKLGDK